MSKIASAPTVEEALSDWLVSLGSVCFSPTPPLDSRPRFHEGRLCAGMTGGPLRHPPKLRCPPV